MTLDLYRSCEDEVLEDIPGFDGKYKVSRNGEVFSICKRGHPQLYKLRGEIDVCGYNRVSLSMGGKHYHKRVCRLVAEAFVPNPEGKPIVNHIDYDRRNDCAENLEWCTQRDNVVHSAKEGRYSNNRAIPVFSLDKNGEIRRYKSAVDAKRDTGAKNISRAIRKPGCQSNSYLWFWTEKEALQWEMKL